MRIVTVKFPERLLEELDAYAARNGLLRSTVIRVAVEEYIRKKPQLKKVIRVKRISLVGDSPSDGDGFKYEDICSERLGRPCWDLDRDEKIQLIRDLLREGWSRHAIYSKLGMKHTVRKIAKQLEVFSRG